jgi:hypothetical protein
MYDDDSTSEWTIKARKRQRYKLPLPHCLETKKAVIKITVPGDEKGPEMAVLPDVTEVFEVEIVE